MNEVGKWCLKNLAIGVFWVFILSVTISNRTIFSYANDVLVQNPVVEFVDQHLADLWHRVAETASVTIDEVANSDDSV